MRCNRYIFWLLYIGHGSWDTTMVAVLSTYPVYTDATEAFSRKRFDHIKVNCFHVKTNYSLHTSTVKLHTEKTDIGELFSTMKRRRILQRSSQPERVTWLVTWGDASKEENFKDIRLQSTGSVGSIPPINDDDHER